MLDATHTSIVECLKLLAGEVGALEQHERLGWRDSESEHEESVGEA